jgi:hypothetical protein
VKRLILSTRSSHESPFIGHQTLPNVVAIASTYVGLLAKSLLTSCGSPDPRPPQVTPLIFTPCFSASINFRVLTRPSTWSIF